MRYFVKLFFLLSVFWVSPIAHAALSTTDESDQAGYLEILSDRWDGGAVDSANSIFRLQQYTSTDWEDFFNKFFNCVPACIGTSNASHAYTNDLDNYLQYPAFYWFNAEGVHLKLQTALVNSLWYKIEAATSAHPSDLGSAMYNDPELRQTLFRRPYFFTRLRLNGEIDPRTNDFNKFKSYIADYPQYFSDNITLDNFAQPFVPMLRAQVWMNFGDVLPMTPTLKNEIAATIGLNGLSGKKLDIWNNSSALVMDNNGLDVAQLNGLYDLFNAIPTGLHNLRYMTVSSFFSSSRWKPLVNKGADGGFINYSFYVNDDSTLNLFFDGSGGTNVRSTETLPSNQWNHVAAVFDGTTVRLYINGVEKGSAPSAGFPVSTSTQALTLGRHIDRGNWLKGGLDEWKIFNRALSAVEINSEFNKQPISNIGLVAHYPMDESTGSVVTDSSGLGNNGTNIGAAIIPGQSNNGLSFNGKDSYVQVADSSSLRMSGAFTLEGWVNVVDEFELRAVPATSGAVNTFSDKLDVLQQQFPSDIAENDAPPIFMSAAAHEINHIVDSYQNTLNPSTWWPNILRLLAQTGRDPMQFLRCEPVDSSCASYLVDNPQEFFAGLSNQYITDTWHTLDHAVQRFNNGYKEPINQFLLFADIYSQASSATKIYAINSTGTVTVGDAAITRDVNGRIVTLRRDDATNHLTYQFTLDTNGNVSAYSLIPDPDMISPSAPSNLTAAAVTKSQINLSWTAATDNVGVVSYDIERCTGKSCTNFVLVGTATGTNYINNGLSARTTYRYRTMAYDAAGNNSAYSNIVKATTPR